MLVLQGVRRGLRGVQGLLLGLLGLHEVLGQLRHLQELLRHVWGLQGLLLGVRRVLRELAVLRVRISFKLALGGRRLTVDVPEGDPS